MHSNIFTTLRDVASATKPIMVVGAASGAVSPYNGLHLSQRCKLGHLGPFKPAGVKHSQTYVQCIGLRLRVGVLF